MMSAGTAASAHIISDKRNNIKPPVKQNTGGLMFLVLMMPDMIA